MGAQPTDIELRQLPRTKTGKSDSQQEKYDRRRGVQRRKRAGAARCVDERPSTSTATARTADGRLGPAAGPPADRLAAAADAEATPPPATTQLCREAGTAGTPPPRRCDAAAAAAAAAEIRSSPRAAAGGQADGRRDKREGGGGVEDGGGCARARRRVAPRRSGQCKQARAEGERSPANARQAHQQKRRQPTSRVQGERGVGVWMEWSAALPAWSWPALPRTVGRRRAALVPRPRCEPARLSSFLGRPHLPTQSGCWVADGRLARQLGLGTDGQVLKIKWQ